MSRRTDPAEAALQRSYRRLLWAYPARWRRRHGDALVGTLLDQAEAQGRGQVSAGDVVDMVRGGATARLRGLIDHIPAAAREAAGALALGSGAGLCVVLFAFGEYSPPWAPPRSTMPAYFGPFATVGPILYALWLAGVLAALARRSRAARALIGAATLAAFALPLAASNAYPHTGLERPSALLLAPLALLGVVVLASRLQRSSPAVVAMAAAVTAAVLVQPLLSYWLQRDAYRPVRDYFYYVWAPEMATQAWVLVALGLILAACLAVRLVNWALAVLVATLPWLAQATAGWILHGTSGDEGQLLAGSAGLAAALGAAALVRLASIRLRLEPRHTDS